MKRLGGLIAREEGADHVPVFGLVAGPWYVAMLLLHGRAFIDNFIMDENLQRFSEPLFGHEGVSTHYLTTILHGMYPWSALLPLANDI